MKRGYICISEKIPPSGELKEKLEKIPVKGLLDYSNNPKEENQKLQKFCNIHLEITMDFTVGLVNDLMLQKSKFLSIIVNKEGIPTHYFTPDDIRRCMLDM